MPDAAFSFKKVFVTGGSGFVGRHVVRELIAHGFHPVCLVRSPEKLRSELDTVGPDRYSTVQGSIFDRDALSRGMDGAAGAIHLVGIIIERRGLFRGQSFRHVHVDGTRNVVDSASKSGLRRICHMSALGARPGAPSAYHRTKFEAEQIVRS